MCCRLGGIGLQAQGRLSADGALPEQMPETRELKTLR